MAPRSRSPFSFDDSSSLSNLHLEFSTFSSSLLSFGWDQQQQQQGEQDQQRPLLQRRRHNNDRGVEFELSKQRTTTKAGTTKNQKRPKSQPPRNNKSAGFDDRRQKTFFSTTTVAASCHNNNNNNNNTTTRPRKEDNKNITIIQHVVLPSDTLQGICLCYKITPTILRQHNRFSGNNLAFAPPKLSIPLTSSSSDGIESSKTQHQNVNSEEYKLYSLLADFRSESLKKDDARSVLEQVNWNLEDASNLIRERNGKDDDDDEMTDKTSVVSSQSSSSSSSVVVSRHSGMKIADAAMRWDVKNKPAEEVNLLSPSDWSIEKLPSQLRRRGVKGLLSVVEETIEFEMSNFSSKAKHE